MRFLFVIFLSTLFCCKGASSLQKEGSVEQAVAAEIGPKATIEKNRSGTFALAYLVKDGSMSFAVVRVSDLKTVVKEELNQGSVSWSGDLQVKVTQTPGIVKLNSKPDDNTRLINLNNYVVNKR